MAERMGLPVLTPVSLRDAAVVEQIAGLDADLIVLADYGRLVPQPVLDLPAHGALNLHPSLLPRHRGATPVAAAILAGDAETGVTLMRMDAGLDTGPIVAQRRHALGGADVAPQLEASLADLGAALLAESFDDWVAGRIPAVAQDGTNATLTRPLRRPDGELDAGVDAEALERQVRAYQPWPGSFVESDAGRLIVWRAVSVQDSGEGVPPGSLLTDGDDLTLQTIDGRLRLLEVQPAGGKRMGGADFVRGRRR